jgi:hypothetical protein
MAAPLHEKPSGGAESVDRTVKPEPASQSPKHGNKKRGEMQFCCVVL